MPKAAFDDLLQFLRKVSAVHESRHLSDAALLQRFQASGDTAALSVLVQRHGPMVLAVCRRVLGDLHSADDVFQATFLVLVRRARTLKCTASLGTWLYAVARRIAIKARAKAAARQCRERELDDMAQREQLDEATWKELRVVLDEEIGRLPEKFSAPVVLCYFQSKCYDQAAKELGWSKSSLANRLTRARELLRQQLVKRGVTLSAAALATALGEKASGAPVAAMLTISTVKAVTSAAAGKVAVGGGISATAVALAEEALKSMAAVKATAIIVALTLALGGAGVAGSGWLQTSGATGALSLPATATAQAPQIKPGPQPKPKNDPPVDLYGDPLPEGAVARLGTARFRRGIGTTAVTFLAGGKTMAAASMFQGGPGFWDAVTGQPLQRPAILDECDSLAFSRDEKLILTNRLRLLDTATGQEIRQFSLLPRDKGSKYRCVILSPDGQTAAAGGSGDDGRPIIALFDLAGGKLLHRIPGHGNIINSLAFSPTGTILASSGSGDKTVHLWEVATGKEIRRFDRNEKSVFHVAFSPIGAVLATAGIDGARLWEVETGKQLQYLEANTELGVSQVCFSADGKTLATGARDGKIALWDPDTGKEIRRWQAHTDMVSCLAFSPDGKMLASGGSYADFAIRRWQTSTGKEIDPLAGHSGPVESLIFGPGGKTLLSCDRGGKIVGWDVSAAHEHRSLYPARDALHDNVHMWLLRDVAPGGEVAALLGTLKTPKQDPVICLWDTASRKEIHVLKVPAMTGGLPAIRFSPDGKQLALGASDGIHLWDVTTGKDLHYLELPEPEFVIRANLKQVWTLAFSPDGKLLAFVDGDNSIRLLEVASGKVLRKWDSQQRGIQVVIFSPDTKSLVSIVDDDVSVWNTAPGKQ